MCVADQRSNDTTCKRYSQTVLEMRTQTYAHTHTPTPTLTHAHTHTHTHTHTCTHSHTLLSQIGIQNDIVPARFYNVLSFVQTWNIFCAFPCQFSFSTLFPLMLQIGSQYDTSCERYSRLEDIFGISPPTFIFCFFPL